MLASAAPTAVVNRELLENLHEAIKKGELKEVQSMLEDLEDKQQGVDHLNTVHDGVKALQCAIQHCPQAQREAMKDLLMQHGAEYYPDPEPLHRALNVGDVEAVKRILDKLEPQQQKKLLATPHQNFYVRGRIRFVCPIAQREALWKLLGIEPIGEIRGPLGAIQRMTLLDEFIIGGNTKEAEKLLQAFDPQIQATKELAERTVGLLDSFSMNLIDAMADPSLIEDHEAQAEQKKESKDSKGIVVASPARLQNLVRVAFLAKTFNHAAIVPMLYHCGISKELMAIVMSVYPGVRTEINKLLSHLQAMKTVTFKRDDDVALHDIVDVNGCTPLFYALRDSKYYQRAAVCILSESTRTVEHQLAAVWPSETKSDSSKSKTSAVPKQCITIDDIHQHDKYGHTFVTRLIFAGDYIAIYFLLERKLICFDDSAKLDDRFRGYEVEANGYIPILWAFDMLGERETVVGYRLKIIGDIFIAMVNDRKEILRKKQAAPQIPAKDSEPPTSSLDPDTPKVETAGQESKQKDQGIQLAAVDEETLYSQATRQVLETILDRIIRIVRDPRLLTRFFHCCLQINKQDFVKEKLSQFSALCANFKKQEKKEKNEETEKDARKLMVREVLKFEYTELQELFVTKDDIQIALGHCDDASLWGVVDRAEGELQGSNSTGSIVRTLDGESKENQINYDKLLAWFPQLSAAQQQATVIYVIQKRLSNVFDALTEQLKFDVKTLPLEGHEPLWGVLSRYTEGGFLPNLGKLLNLARKMSPAQLNFRAANGNTAISSLMRDTSNDIAILHAIYLLDLGAEIPDELILEPQLFAPRGNPKLSFLYRACYLFHDNAVRKILPFAPDILSPEGDKSILAIAMHQGGELAKYVFDHLIQRHTQKLAILHLFNPVEFQEKKINPIQIVLLQIHQNETVQWLLDRGDGVTTAVANYLIKNRIELAAMKTYDGEKFEKTPQFIPIMEKAQSVLSKTASQDERKADIDTDRKSTRDAVAGGLHLHASASSAPVANTTDEVVEVVAAFVAENETVTQSAAPSSNAV